jgi:2-oxo-3-hexenedioate decarboxylase
MVEFDVIAVAQEMLVALDDARVVTPPTQHWPDLDFVTAYRVAAELQRRRRARGEQAVGRKIGYTNRIMWAQYDVHEPIWDHVYAHTVQRADGNTALQSLARMIAPRIEPEIAFGLSAPPAGCTDPAVILLSCQWVARAFEIIDCHYSDWKFRGPDSVIDFSHHAALIVGEPLEIATRDIPRLVRELHDCRVTLVRDGTVADTGVGANALGHPALALAHLADVLASQPAAAPLEPGEVVTTGSLTAALPVERGETWRTDTEGLALPSLTVTFE